ncbi:hypothetical protein G9A89_008990 [Geosiphon pyriformis]|nr:hypothetical protein G9A89_008990 [Geosiphon pyriformis]
MCVHLVRFLEFVGIFFGGRTWAQITGGFFSHVAFSVSFGTVLSLVAETSLFASALSGNCNVYGCLASLKHTLELLADQVSGILEKLGSIKLVPLTTISDASPLAVPMSVVSGLDLNMVLDNASVISNLSPPVINDTASVISSSGSKVLTTKIGGLESKMKIAMCNVFTSGLDSSYIDSGIVVIMDISLARHVCKVTEVPGQLLSIKLLFKNKLSVSILGLYIGASSVVCFSQANKINSFIVKALNEFSFVVLGEDFNENGSHKYASFKKCLSLELVNSLLGSSVAENST